MTVSDLKVTAPELVEKSIDLGSLDLDGKADLVTANQSTANISILLGKGNGTFNSAINSAVGTTPWGIALGDFNGNGRFDLAIANYGSNNVSVLLDRCATPKRRAVRH